MEGLFCINWSAGLFILLVAFISGLELAGLFFFGEGDRGIDTVFRLDWGLVGVFDFDGVNAFFGTLLLTLCKLKCGLTLHNVSLVNGKLSGSPKTSELKLNASSNMNGHRRPHLHVPGEVKWRRISSREYRDTPSGLQWDIIYYMAQ